MKNKTTNFGRSPNKEIFVKSAIQVAIVLLTAGGIANAQTATPAKADEKAAATQEVQQVVVTSTGTRGSNRTVIDTPVPIDILAASELTKTAQASLDKALAFRVPSFNTVQTPVNGCNLPARSLRDSQYGSKSLVNFD